MEIPDKIAYPIIIGMALTLIKMLASARNFIRPKVPGNGKRLTIEEMFYRLHADIAQMRDVDMLDITRRIGTLENHMRAWERERRDA